MKFELIANIIFAFSLMNFPRKQMPALIDAFDLKSYCIISKPPPITFEEKHLASPPSPDTRDKKSHLYTAIIGADNSVTLLVDNYDPHPSGEGQGHGPG